MGCRSRRARRAVLAALALLACPAAAAPASAADPGFPLYLPLAPGAEVAAGGPHPRDRVGTLASVDFGLYRGELDVYAAAPGLARVFDDDGFSSCYVVVFHEGGWETSYYHLKDVDLSVDGAMVEAGRRLGRAGQPGTETCGFGTPGFRHVHFSLSRNGVDMPINGTSIGGYTVHRGSADYCGGWTRDVDGALVVDAEPACGAREGLRNDQLLPSGTSLPPPPPADAVPPRTRLSGAALQRLSGTITVDVACLDEACRARVDGTVEVTRAGGAVTDFFALRAGRRTIAAGTRVQIGVGVPPAARAAIRRTLTAARRIVAELSIETADASGNSRVVTRRVRLRP